MSARRVALATCTAWPTLDNDGPELRAALAAEGLDVDLPVWDDPSVDWAAYDLVVIRSTWDYWLRRDDYLAWARSVPRLANEADVVAWNTDKTYLRALEAEGIPIVPTTWLTPGDSFVPPDVPFVVKPTVSAGAQDTAAYPAGAADARAHVEGLLSAGRGVMLQPYVASVDTEGETSVLVFEGAPSHSARKRAILTVGGGIVRDLSARYVIEPHAASAEEVALAQEVVDLVQGWGHDLLYARVDLLPGPVLIELEVTEPSLFLEHAPGSAQRFAQAVVRRVERTAGATPRS